MSDIVRILIVDDSAYVRKVIRQMLSRSPFFEIVGAARDGREALEMTEELRPDELEFEDPEYPVTITVRAVKAGELR